MKRLLLVLIMAAVGVLAGTSIYNTPTRDEAIRRSKDPFRYAVKMIPGTSVTQTLVNVDEWYIYDVSSGIEPTIASPFRGWETGSVGGVSAYTGTNSEVFVVGQTKFTPDKSGTLELCFAKYTATYKDDLTNSANHKICWDVATAPGVSKREFIFANYTTITNGDEYAVFGKSSVANLQLITDKVNFSVSEE